MKAEITTSSVKMNILSLTFFYLIYSLPFPDRAAQTTALLPPAYSLSAVVIDNRCVSMCVGGPSRISLPLPSYGEERSGRRFGFVAPD